MTVLTTQLLYTPLNEEPKNKINIREKKEISNTKKLNRCLCDDRNPIWP